MAYNMNSVSGNDAQPKSKDVSLSFIENVANQVFQEIGSGQNENIYREAMLYEFRLRKYDVSGEVSVPVKYKDVYLSYVHGRIDILLEKEVVLELKTIASCDLFGAVQQCKSYMKYLNKPKGYVINFPKTDKGKLVVQEITTAELHYEPNIIKYIHSINVEVQKNNTNIELILRKLENLENSIREIHECTADTKSKIIRERDNIVLLIEETASSLKIDEETEGETDLETDDGLEEVEEILKKDTYVVIKEEKAKLEVIKEELEEDDTEVEIVEKEEEEQEVIELEEEEEEQVVKKEEEEDEQEEEEEEEEEEEQEEEEEEEEEELFEIEIENVTYCTNNEDNGIIYELEKDGNVGKQIGYLKDGEAIFT